MAKNVGLMVEENERNSTDFPRKMTNSGLAASSLSVLFLIVIPLHAISPNNVCPKTRNPSFCFSVLKSAATTDLRNLTAFTLNIAHSNATGTLSLVRSLAAAAAGARLKERYSSCAENYDEAVGDIEEAKNYLASGDYNGVNVAAAGVMAEVEDCEDNFNLPPEDPSSLPKNGKTLDDICSIILVLSNLLLGNL